jgi:hypothetical protein
MAGEASRVEKHTGLKAVALLGPDAAAETTSIPRGTLVAWAYRTKREQFHLIRDGRHGPEARELAVEFADISKLSLAKVREIVENIDVTNLPLRPDEAARVAANLTKISAAATDRMQVLRDRPDHIVAGPKNIDEITASFDKPPVELGRMTTTEDVLGVLAVGERLSYPTLLDRLRAINLPAKRYTEEDIDRGLQAFAPRQRRWGRNGHPHPHPPRLGLQAHRDKYQPSETNEAERGQRELAVIYADVARQAATKARAGIDKINLDQLERRPEILAQAVGQPRQDSLHLHRQDAGPQWTGPPRSWARSRRSTSSTRPSGRGSAPSGTLRARQRR